MSFQKKFVVLLSSFKLTEQNPFHILTVSCAHSTLLTLLPSRPALLILLQHLLHNLLLLDQESPHNPIPDAVRAPRSSIRALHGLLRAGHAGVFSGTEGWEL